MKVRAAPIDEGFQWRDEKSVNFWLERTCLARLGNPEDVVGPACFLASDDAAFVTGQSLNVCGGIIYD